MITHSFFARLQRGDGFVKWPGMMLLGKGRGKQKCFDGRLSLYQTFIFEITN